MFSFFLVCVSIVSHDWVSLMHLPLGFNTRTEQSHIPLKPPKEKRGKKGNAAVYQMDAKSPIITSVMLARSV